MEPTTESNCLCKGKQCVEDLVMCDGTIISEMDFSDVFKGGAKSPGFCFSTPGVAKNYLECFDAEEIRVMAKEKGIYITKNIRRKENVIACFIRDYFKGKPSFS